MYLPLPGLERVLQRGWSRWVMRGRRGTTEFRADEGGWVLTYAWRYRLTAFVAFAAFTAICLAAFSERTVFVPTLKGALLAAGSLLVWLLAAGFFLSSLIERVVVTPTELRRRSWRGRQAIVWGAVTHVEVREENGDVRIDALGGAVIEVSLYLNGLGALAQALGGRPRLP